MKSSDDLDRPQIVIGLTGRMGSGKTAIADILKNDFGFCYIRYSFVLAEWFKTDPDAKADLQRLGWNVMSGHSQVELNRRLLAKIDRRDWVVDGLRHPIDYESLRNKFRAEFSLIFVQTSSNTRFSRLQNR